MEGSYRGQIRRLLHLVSPHSRNLIVLVVTIWGFLVIMFSNVVLNQLVSDCGRLVMEALPATLASNNATLKLPAGKTWSEMKLTYSLKDGEALNFVVNRQGHEFSVVRISRLPFQESAYLLFSEGEVTRRIALQLSPGHLPNQGQVIFSRVPGKISVFLENYKLVDVPTSVSAGDFETNMFPPHSPKLFERVKINQIRLDNGKLLHPNYFYYVSHSPIFFLVLSIMLSCSIFKIAGPSCFGLFSHQNKSIGIILISFTSVCLVVGYLMHRGAVFGSFYDFKRDPIRVFFILWYFLVFFIIAVRLAVFRRSRWFPRAHFRYMKQASAVSVFMICVGFVVFLLYGFPVFVSHHSESRAMEDTCQECGTRVICYGGSTTRGYPYIDESFPKIMQESIRREVDPTAFVWNMGIEAGTIKHIQRRIAGDVAAIKPTHVVIDSVVNNLGYEKETLQTAYDNVINQISHLGDKIFIVEEPQISMLNLGDQSRKMFQAIRAIGQRRGAHIVDTQGVFFAHRDEFLFMDVCHLTFYGKILLADVIAKAMFPQLSDIDLKSYVESTPEDQGLER